MAQEGEQIAHELKRLFELHDKRLTEERLGFLLTEIASMRIPLQAILSGIRKLANSDVQHLKYSLIANAIKEEYSPILSKSKCIKCDETGRICFVSPDGHNCCLACVCDNGRVFREQGMIVWNGDVKQVINGIEMVRYEFKLLGEKNYNKIYREKV